jgi:hypothetical protein
MELEYNTSKTIAKRARRLLSEISINRTPLGKFYQFTIGICGAFITLSLLMLMLGASKVYEDFPFYVICLAVFVFSIAFYLTVKWLVNEKIIKNTGLHNSIIKYVIMPDKIVHYTDNGLKLELTGNDIKRFIDYKEYLFMLVRDNYAYYMPPNAFANSSERETAKKMIQSILNNCSANNTLQRTSR